MKKGQTSSFARGCACKYKDLAEGYGYPSCEKDEQPKKPRKKRKGPRFRDECRRVLSDEMKRGNRKGALKMAWACQKRK